MLLVQPPVGVFPHRLGEKVQDVGDPLLDDVGRLGLGDRVVEEHEELAQGGLVHHVHLAQLHDEKVEDAATRGYGSEGTQFKAKKRSYILGLNLLYQKKDKLYAKDVQ